MICLRRCLIVCPRYRWSFRYLGIVVTKDPKEYITLNLKPLLQKFKNKCATWCKLPLSVTRKVNLTKMIWAPQLLYILHNVPVLIPKYWYQHTDSKFRSLIWKNKVVRLKKKNYRTVSQRPRRNGCPPCSDLLFRYANTTLHRMESA